MPIDETFILLTLILNRSRIINSSSLQGDSFLSVPPERVEFWVVSLAAVYWMSRNAPHIQKTAARETKFWVVERRK